MAQHSPSTTLSRPPGRPAAATPAAVAATDGDGAGRRSRPGSPGAMGSGSPTPRPGDQLPAPADSFVGRVDELAAIAGLFERSRLVTITGAPGMGKTRLAVEVARARAGSQHHVDGVWLVHLAPVSGPDLLAPAVARAFGASEPAPGDEGDYSQVIARIGSSSALLVLDNCEHVLPAAARLVAHLLEGCPNVSLLATSQERLAVPGEHVWPLTGLSLPHEHEPGKAAAVDLFGQRAYAANPGFVLDEGNFDAVVEICRRLDGIPLAIELAAARVATFSPADIARHLDDRFSFLTGGARTALPRHQTLRAAVDWSYDLLEEPEKAVLRRMSMFAGGASPAAVDEVCAGEPVDAGSGLHIVTRLAARSLVVAVDSATGARFHLLETIRSYGRERLAEAGEVTSTAARHVAHFVAVAEAAEPALTDARQQSCLAHLDLEYDNLRVAMAWSLDQGPAEPGLRIASALALYWRFRGRFWEAGVWFDRAIAMGGADLPPALSAKAHWSRALMAAMVGEDRSAAADAAASLEAWKALGDPRGTARSLLLLGALSVRPPEGHMSVLQSAIALARQAGDSWCLSLALARCGTILAADGDLVAARSMLQEAAQVSRDAADLQSLAYTLVALGRVARCQGDYEAAAQALHEAVGVSAGSGAEHEAATAYVELALLSVGRGRLAQARDFGARARLLCSHSPSVAANLELALLEARLALAGGDLAEARRCLDWLSESLGDSGTSPHVLIGQGELALAATDLAGAQERFDRAFEISRGRDPRVGALALSWLGTVARLDGDSLSAAACHHQALATRVAVGERPAVLDSLEALAGIAARTGRAERAVRLFAAAQAARDSLGYARPIGPTTTYEADVGLTLQELGEGAYREAWAAGQEMSVDEAVAFVSKGRGAREARPVSGVGALTDAERQVARMLFDHLTNAEISFRLFVSVSTVKTHLTRAFAKLGVANRAELVNRYARSDF